MPFFSKRFAGVLAALLALVLAGAAGFGRSAPREEQRVAPPTESAASPIAVPSPPEPALVSPAQRPPLPPAERTQFVLLGMDTTPHGHRGAFEDYVELLNAHRDPTAPPVSFTLFIGTTSLQLDESRRDLTPAELVFQAVPPRPSPVFDYARDLAEIEETAGNVRRLDALGVEIGSHSVRHAHGGEWTRERWELEMTDHARILALARLPSPVGFRAPFLEANESLYESLAAHGFSYDCSETRTARFWPTRHPGTEVWQFAVPSVEIPGRDRPVLFYDLNLESRLRRAASDAGVHGEAAVQSWMDETFFQIASAEFQQRYRGSRAPFLISGHGGFRVPIARVMRRVCALPHVRCSTFREAAEYMRAHPEMEGAL